MKVAAIRFYKLETFPTSRVFELTPKSGGGFAFSLLNEFNGNSGASPSSGVFVGSSGIVYGTTHAGGDSVCAPFGCGVIFAFAP